MIAVVPAAPKAATSMAETGHKRAVDESLKLYLSAFSGIIVMARFL